MTFKSILIIIMSAVFVNNYVLSKFLGICPFLGVSKKLDQATGMSIAVIVVMCIATAVTWPVSYTHLDVYKRQRRHCKRVRFSRRRRNAYAKRC